MRKTGFLLLYAMFTFFSLSGAEKMNTIPVTIKHGVTIEAELAFDDETRAKGLMHRQSLPDDAGMLFLFSKLDYHGFWMKNTLIPLDIIWLNERKEIVYFVTASPCKADPCTPLPSMQKARYVLEVNAGFVKKQSLKIGSTIDFTVPESVQVK